MMKEKKPELIVYNCQICDGTWLTLKALKIHAQIKHHLTIMNYDTYEIKGRI